MFVSIVLLVIFAASIPYSLRGGQGASAIGTPAEDAWPLKLAIGVLAGAGHRARRSSPTGSSRRSSRRWRRSACRRRSWGSWSSRWPGNAVENVVGIQQAMRNRTDLAISLIQNSSLQIALALTPVLVLASLFISPVPMTLVLTPTLLVGMALTAVLGAFIVFDGESTWLEGLMLLGLYLIIAASVWYGPAITV